MLVGQACHWRCTAKHSSVLLQEACVGYVCGCYQCAAPATVGKIICLTLAARKNDDTMNGLEDQLVRVLCCYEACPKLNPAAVLQQLLTAQAELL